MSLKKILLIIMVFSGVVLRGQPTNFKTPTQVRSLPDEMNGRIQVEFNNETQVENLLVLVTDSLGQTIFLENLHRFKGAYKKSIDLPYKGKGTVTLHINKDQERIIKKIPLK